MLGTSLTLLLCFLPLWPCRYDEGAFIGGKDSGSPLHVDQVSWSNVGKVLLAFAPCLRSQR